MRRFSTFPTLVMLSVAKIAWADSIQSGWGQIDTNSDCPTAQLISQALEKTLAPEHERNQKERRLVIRQLGRDLVLQYEKPPGEVMATRTLKSSESADGAKCQEAADQVAMALWSLEAELSPGVLESAHFPEVPPPKSEPAPPVLPRRLLYQIDAAFLASWALADFAPGGRLAVTLAPERSHWGGRFAVWGTGERRVDFASSSVSIAWTRVGFHLGPIFRVNYRDFVFDFHAGFNGALAILDARGTTPSGRTLSFDPGLSGGVSFGWRIRRAKLLPYLGTELLGWLRKQELNVQNPTEIHVIPQFEAMLVIGLAVGTF